LPCLSKIQFKRDISPILIRTRKKQEKSNENGTWYKHTYHLLYIGYLGNLKIKNDFKKNNYAKIALVSETLK